MSTEHDDFELDDSAEGLLAALRSEEALPQAMHDRVWARVETSVANAGLPDRWSTGKKLAAAAFLAAAAAMVFTVASPDAATRRAEDSSPTQAAFGHADSQTGGIAANQEPSQEPRTLRGEAHPGSETRPGAAAVTPEITPSVAPEVPPDLAPASSSAPAATSQQENASAPAVRAVPSPSRRSPPPAREAPSTLADEVAMIEAIREALLADSPNRALDHVRAHARRFPHGVLAQEREALRAVAMCTAGRTGARAKSQAFIEAHPHSPLVAKVRAACGDEEKNGAP